MSDAAPLVKSIQTTIPALGAAVAGDQVVGEAPFAGAVTGATLTAEAAIVGDDDDSRTLTIVNAGADGTGETVVATLAFETGTDADAHDELAFTLSEVEDATTVAAGDVLVVAEAVAGNGLANPGGLVTIELSRGA